MARLEDKVQSALDEGHILIMGAQVLVGVQYRSCFEKRFDSLPLLSQYLKVAGLAGMLVAIALLMAPIGYHWLAVRGQSTDRMHRLATATAAGALLPFAAGLGIDSYVAVQSVAGALAALIAGACASLTALFFWYGLQALQRRRAGARVREMGREPVRASRDDEGGPDAPQMTDKIRHALTEIKIVLPGAQALLGFQFAVVLTERFESLPAVSKYVHLAGTSLVALSTIFLIAPASYHRLVEMGEETGRFYAFAGRMVLAAMAALALGVCCDLFVVMGRVTESLPWAVAAALVLLALFYGLWFGYALCHKDRARRGATLTGEEAEQPAAGSLRADAGPDAG